MQKEKKKEKVVFYRPYKVIGIMCILFIIYALILEDIGTIKDGILTIILKEDILIMDYLELVGFATTLVNVALVGLGTLFVVYILGIKPNGSTIMAIFMAMGFSFFGKNIYNIWPPMIGVYFFSLFQKRDFKNYSLVCILSSSLAPIVTQSLHLGIKDPFIGALTGIFLGITAGFFLPAIATYSVRVHSGYSLYNVGFASGIVCTFYLSIAKLFGAEIQTQLFWSTEYKLHRIMFIIVICLALIIVGFVEKKGEVIPDLKKIFKHPGRLVTDFYILYGGSAYVNMGLLGLLSLSVLCILGMDVNGPTIGAIFTVIGFGAFGKHLKNTWSIIAGAAIACFLSENPLSPGNSLAILFCTNLAPIAGQFGWIWGIIAGFLHVCLVSNVGFLHGGLNLYNNGFAGGFVALILVPIIAALRRSEENEA